MNQVIAYYGYDILNLSFNFLNFADKDGDIFIKMNSLDLMYSKFSVKIHIDPGIIL